MDWPLAWLVGWTFQFAVITLQTPGRFIFRPVKRLLLIRSKVGRLVHILNTSENTKNAQNFYTFFKHLAIFDLCWFEKNASD